MRQTSTRVFIFDFVFVFFLFFVATQFARAQFTVPSFSDLTIKIQNTRGMSLGPETTTFYFKGPRERIEHSLNFDHRKPTLVWVAIDQCDLSTGYHLHPQNQTYIESHFHNREQSKRREFRLLGRAKTGPEVLVTFTSVETGDEKQVGPYQARRIKTTITVEPTKGAATSPATVRADGWYLDIRGLNCMEHPPGSHLWQPPRYGPNDRIVIKRNGPEPEGLLIEGRSITTQGGNRAVDKAEIVKVSEEPLEDSLFELPSGYAPVTPGHPQIRRDSIGRSDN